MQSTARTMAPCDAVTFDVATDPASIRSTCRTGWRRAPNLPPDVNTFGLTMRKATGFPMLIIGLSSPEGPTTPFLALRQHQHHRRALSCATWGVRIFSANDYAMRIWVKPDRLATLG